MKMAEFELTIPLKEEEVKKLKIGDIVYLNGIFYTGRDEMHIRTLKWIEEGKAMPIALEDGVIFHCGPIMRKKNEKWELVAAGPTTSSRMNSLEPDFIEKTGVRAIIGKGGMSRPTIEAMKKYKAVYLALTGGAAVLAAKGVKKVEGVHWLDLGMPEAIWIFEGNRFGPLTVAIDTWGNSLYEAIEAKIEKNLPEVREKLNL
jgi:fumarate hydratase subunit beta